MHMEQIKLMLMIINMLVSAGVWIFVWLDRRRSVTTESIEKHEQNITKKLDNKCARIAKLEAEFSSLPSSDEIIRIHERIDDLNKGSQQTQLMIGELIGQVKQMNQERNHGT